MWPRYYDQNKKEFFPKIFEIVTISQQNVSNRVGDGGGDGSSVMVIGDGGDAGGGDGSGDVGVDGATVVVVVLG